LTTYSPYEGYRIAFNGTKGRIDAWIQESKAISDLDYDQIILFKTSANGNTSMSLTPAQVTGVEMIY
jgi:hypothetical protein